LPALDRLDAGAEDFGEIGGVIEHESDDRRRKIRQRTPITGTKGKAK
jgi:hypothetical protein